MDRRRLPHETSLEKLAELKPVVDAFLAHCRVDCRYAVSMARRAVYIQRNRVRRAALAKQRQAGGLPSSMTTEATPGDSAKTGPHSAKFPQVRAL